MPTKEKSFWLSYDFGLRGNYSGLFNFLDNWKAIECGNNLAYFIYSNPDDLSIEKLLEKIMTELSDTVNPEEKDRIYLIWRDGLKVKGRFIYGRRKKAPWFGYGDRSTIDNETDDAV